MAWGVKPAAMTGHSVGEYVAGCLAGVFSLEDALILVARRAELVQAQAPGSMLAVRLPEPEIRPLLNGGLSIAAINSPSLCVVSGPDEAVAKLEQQMTERGVASKALHTSHAFHSAMMDPVVAPFTDLLRKTRQRAPQIPYVSNVTGQWITTEEATSPEYWAGHVRQTVRFSDGAGELMKDSTPHLVGGRTRADTAPACAAASRPQGGATGRVHVGWVARSGIAQSLGQRGPTLARGSRLRLAEASTKANTASESFCLLIRSSASVAGLLLRLQPRLPIPTRFGRIDAPVESNERTPAPHGAALATSRQSLRWRLSQGTSVGLVRSWWRNFPARVSTARRREQASWKSGLIPSC